MLNSEAVILSSSSWPNLAVDDLAHVLVVTEHERHVEGVDVGYHRAESAEADAGHLHRADLQLFHYLLFRTQHTAGEHAVLQLAVGGFFEFLAEVFQRHHRRIAGRMHLGQLQRSSGLRQSLQTQSEGKGGDEQLAFEVHVNLHLVFVGCSVAGVEASAEPAAW